MDGQRDRPRTDEEVTPMCHLASRTLYYSLTDIQMDGQRKRQRADKQRGDLYVILLKQAKIYQSKRLLHVNFIQEPQKTKIMPMQYIMHKLSSVPIAAEIKWFQERMLTRSPPPQHVENTDSYIKFGGCRLKLTGKSLFS